MIVSVGATYTHDTNTYNRKFFAEIRRVMARAAGFEPAMSASKADALTA